MAEDLQRLERDQQDLALRLRALENLEAPSLHRTVEDVRWLRDKVLELDVQGTAVTRIRFEDMGRENERLWIALKDVRDTQLAGFTEIAADRKALSRMLKTTAVATAGTIAAQVILFFFIRAVSR